MDILTHCLGRRSKVTSSTQPVDDDATQAANSFVDTLYLAEKNGLELRLALDGIIRTNNWRGNLARAIFETLQNAIQSARPMGAALREIREKVINVLDGIEGFMKEHPIFCALIALGILVLLSPWA